MSHDHLGTFTMLRFPLSRTPTVDTVRMGKSRHHVPLLLEVDVTAARALIRRRRQSGEDLSFTGWAIGCLGQAVSEHERIHALRRGRRRLFVFGDVDVCVAVQRQLTESRFENGAAVGGRPRSDEGVAGAPGETLPMPFVVRRANLKDVEQISGEIRAAQAQPLAPGQQWLGPQDDTPPLWQLRLYNRLPWLLRKWLVWVPLLSNPRRVKATMGTVMITSVPVTSESGGGGWVIPIGIHPLIVALGGVATKPGVVGPLAEPTCEQGAECRVEPRDLLSLTVLFDHDVIDGVPAAVFVRRLTELMEDAFGLDS